MSDAPIDPQEWAYGVKVVDIGDLRVARGMTRRPYSSCKHQKLTYCDKERRVWCQDCESEVEPFDAFTGLVSYFSAAQGKIERRRKELDEAEKFQVRSRAAKVMDDAWRKTSMAPLCPHCSKAILPEDVAGGVAETSKSLVVASRKRDKQKKP